MASARLALKKLASPASAPARPLIRSRRWLSTEASAGDVAVSEAGGSKKKSGLFPRRHRRRGGGLWRNTGRDDFVPALYEFFPSGLGDALLQASRNINRLFENLAPAGLVGRVKEQDDCYKLRFEVPGLGKDDVNIRVEDGFLVIKGEHKEEEEAAGSEDDDDDGYWALRRYGYYNTRLALPEDAKADEIKAEMKDGVLTIMVPRAERSKRDVKEIQID